MSHTALVPRAQMVLRVDLPDGGELLAALEALQADTLRLRTPHALAQGTDVRLSLRSPALKTPWELAVQVIARQAAQQPEDSTVDVTIAPAATDDRARLAALVAQLAARRVPTLRLLLVDDNPHIQQMYARALQRAFSSSEASVVVEAATNGLEALQRLGRDPPVHAVFTDLSMPVLDGRGLLVRMRQDARFRAVPVIIITAEDPSGDDALRDLDVRAILHKPVQLQQVVDAARELLRTLPR